MKVTILENATVKYGEYYLTPFQTYNDIDDATAQELIKNGDAKLASDKIEGVSVTTEPRVPHTKKFDPKANGGYVAEAKLSASKKAELEANGEVDPTAVTGEDNTQPKDEKTQVVEKTEVLGENGQPLTDEEIQAKERATTAAAPNDSIPANNVEANSQGEEVK